MRITRGCGLLSMAVLSCLLLPACGVHDVAGHYTGTVNGSTKVLGITFPVVGTASFDLAPAGTDNYQATGQLEVKRQSDGMVTYSATLNGGYQAGKLNLTFTATDKSSSGTMVADLFGVCWNNGTWTLVGVATSGSGSWSACR